MRRRRVAPFAACLHVSWEGAEGAETLVSWTVVPLPVALHCPLSTRLADTTSYDTRGTIISATGKRTWKTSAALLRVDTGAMGDAQLERLHCIP